MMEEPRKGHFLEPTVHLEDQCFGDALCFKFKFWFTFVFIYI